ncbi:MAG: lipid-binding SYLF domain-containing protein [Proteobacteria bacterium]|nr:lipid-binding SYLF domain-containing protein [Pseudomonadota bacterium]
MRKTITTAALGLTLIGATSLTALPAMAQSTSNDQATNTSNDSRNGNNGGNASKPDRLLQNATKAVQDMKSDSHFANLMTKCKGMFIIPSMGKGGFIIGGKGGQGVLVRRTSNGWSEPAFLTLGSISLGAQAGGSGGETIMLLMTSKAMHDFTQANNFSLGANAGLTVVNYSAKGQAPVGKGDVIIWSNKSGAFAGATVSATDITSNKPEDKNFYGKSVSTTQIIKGKVQHQQAADQLESTLS